MSGISQDIRYASPNINSVNNPQSLYTATKPSRIIITDGVPEQEDGELLWYAIDQDTGVLYKKTEESGGQWQGIYQFSGGAGSITDGSNVGTGNQIFREKNGSVLEFKTLISQPSPLESSLILADNGINTEVNISAPRTISNITNYGLPTVSEGWVIDTFRTNDSNNNIELYAKPIKAGNNITVSEFTAGSDKYIEISAVIPPAAAQQYHFSYQSQTSYSIIANQFNNIPPFTNSLTSSEWVFNPNINGSSFVQYIGPPNVAYKFDYNISCASTAQTQQFNFIFRLAEGDPLVSQNGVPLSGAIVHIPAAPSPITYFTSTSTSFIIIPSPNQYYGLQISCSLAPQQTLTVEEFKFVISKI